MSKPKKAAPAVRAPGAGRKPRTSMPVMQVRPVIKKKQISTMVGRDLVRGVSAQTMQKGVQCQIRQTGLDGDGKIASPFVARTVGNYETTKDNSFVREGIATPDQVYEMLINHPARQRVVKSTRNGKTIERTIPGRFVLTPYIPELTEEEEVMAREGSNGGYEGPLNTERGQTSIMGNGVTRDMLDGVPESAPRGATKTVKEATHLEVEEDIVV